MRAHFREVGAGSVVEAVKSKLTEGWALTREKFSVHALNTRFHFTLFVDGNVPQPGRWFPFLYGTLHFALRVYNFLNINKSFTIWGRDSIV